MKIALLVGVTALAALAGCGDATSPTAGPATSWQEPASYEYTVDSHCGERLLIGTFTMTVADGKVTKVMRKDAGLPEAKPETFPPSPICSTSTPPRSKTAPTWRNSKLIRPTGIPPRSI